MSCKKHKRYKAVRKPRANCDHCWGMWLYAEVQRAQKIMLPNTMTKRCLFKAVRNHRHAVEKHIRESK